MAARNDCCCKSEYFPRGLAKVMRKLHLEEGVVTEEECEGINKGYSWFIPDYTWASPLSLVLCTKSEEQYKVAIKTLEGYPSELTKLTLKYLPVLSELYENKLITSEDVQEMKRMEGDLMTIVVSIQCGKEADIITKTAEIIRKHDFTEESKILTALGDISQEGLMSKEEIQKEWKKSWWSMALNPICTISCTKEPSVVTRIVDILQKCGLSGEEEVMLLKALGDISQEGLMSKEEIEEIQKKWKGSLWSIALKHFCIISCTKDPSVVTRIVDILQKCGLSGREEVMLLKALGDISQEGLMSKEEIQQVPKCWEGSSLWSALDSICTISCTKELSMMTRIADILQKSGFTDQKHVMLLKALGDISQEGLMSKKEVQQVLKCWKTANSICKISCTKEPSVMTRIADILLKSGFTDQEHVMLLKALGDISQEGLMSKEEIEEIQKKWKGSLWSIPLKHFCAISCTKDPSVVTRIAQILQKCGLSGREEVMLLKALGDISQEGLMSKEEVQQVPKCWEGYSLKTALNSICTISCTKEPSMMTRIADILQKSGFTDQKHVMLLKVVSKLLEKNLLTNKLFVGKENKDMWGQFVTIFVHQCPRPLEISLETAIVFEEHGMMKEATLVRAGSKAIHQVFRGIRSTTVDVSSGSAAMKVVSGVLGVLLLHEDRYSLAATTTEDELIVKFQDVSELSSRVLPEEIKDVEWNVVRTVIPVHYHIADCLVDVGVNHELGEKAGKLIEYYWGERLSKEECYKMFSSPHWRNESERLTKVKFLLGRSMKGFIQEAQSHPSSGIVRRSYPDPRQAQSLSHVPPRLKTSTLLHARSTLTSGYSSMASSSRELSELSEIEPDMITLEEMQTTKHPHTTSGVKVKRVEHLKSLDPTPSSGGSSDPPRRDPGPDHDHESHLLEQCWIPFGIQTLHITQNGGEFLLEPATPEHSDINNRAFRMEVPATAISRDSLEVRYGIILDGPFALPRGYRLASPVVYVWFDHSKVTKSLKFHIPHWVAGDHGHLEEDVSFVISPHVLPEGEQMYTFAAMELECTSLHDTFGTVELSGHCSLLGLAMREKIPSCYLATPWKKVDGNKLHLKVAIVYCIQFWLKVLSEYWESWTYCGGDETCPVFEVTEERVTSKLRKRSGNGWEAGLNQAAINKMAVAYHLHNTEEKMEFAVKNGLYPPSFFVKIIQSCSPGCATVPAAVYLDISGTSLGDLCFSVEVQETVSEKVSPPNNAGTMSPPTSGLDDPHTPQSTEFHNFGYIGPPNDLQQPPEVPVSPGVGLQELAGLNREESVSPERETNSFQNIAPSDVGLQGVLDKVPVWHSLAIRLGVPIEQVEAWDSNKPLGGLLALGYWRDGKSGDLFPPTWGFLLRILKESKGPNVADALEKEVRSNPAWSST